MLKKIITTVLVIGMSLSLVGCSNTKEEISIEKNKTPEIVETLEKPVTVSKANPIKKETVYALLDNSGKVDTLIVSDELKNFKEGEIADKTDLKNITNVKGDEEFKIDGNNINWSSEGRDIYYQGTTDKQLPITVNVSYKLDGREVSADELKGKSGHVQIRYDFCNNTNSIVKGKEYKIPFVCVAGTILDNAHFYNVEIANGKAIDDGNHTAIMGYAVPGIVDSLGLKQEYKDKIGNKTYFEISADVVDFTIGNTFVAVSNSLIQDNDSLDLSKIDDLQSDIDKLADGMKELKDGSNKLLDGTIELKDGLYQLSSNSDALNDGANTIFDTVVATAVKQINEGLAVKVGPDTANALTAGINKNNYKEKINGIIKTVATSGVSAAITDDEIKTISALMIAEELQKGEASDLSNSNITAKTLNQIAYIKEHGSVELSDNQKLIVTLIQGDYSELIKDSTKQVLTDLAAYNLSEKQVTPVVCLMIANIIDKSGSSALSVSSVVSATEQTLAVPSASGLTNEQKLIVAAVGGNYNDCIDITLQTVKQKLVEQTIAGPDFDSMRGAIDSLNKVGYFCSSLKKYTDGVDAAYDGSKKLSDGAKELRDGLKKFDDEGISKLVDMVKNDLKKVTDNLDNLKVANETYDIFTDKAENVESSVNFVYRIGSID